MRRGASEIVAEHFGENLRRVRRREGLSQEQPAPTITLETYVHLLDEGVGEPLHLSMPRLPEPKTT